MPTYENQEILIPLQFIDLELIPHNLRKILRDKGWIYGDFKVIFEEPKYGVTFEKYPIIMWIGSGKAKEILRSALDNGWDWRK